MFGSTIAELPAAEAVRPSAPEAAACAGPPGPRANANMAVTSIGSSRRWLLKKSCIAISCDVFNAAVAPRLARAPRIEAFRALSRPPKPPPRLPIPLCQWTTEPFRRKHLSGGNALSVVLRDHRTGRVVQDQPLGEGGYRSALAPSCGAAAGSQAS